jgi:hypothetical protein
MKKEKRRNRRSYRYIKRYPGGQVSTTVSGEVGKREKRKRREENAAIVYGRQTV